MNLLLVRSPLGSGDTEENDGAAILEIVRNIFIRRAENLQRPLVERVVVALPHAYGKPCVAPFHLACHSLGLRLPSESLFLCRILYLEQQPLLLQCLYRG